MAKASEKKRQIKILLPEHDHYVVKVAAAVSDSTIAEFCRDVVIREAQKLTKGMNLPDSAGKRKKGTS
jgi:hypothetical protein